MNVKILKNLTKKEVSMDWFVFLERKQPFYLMAALIRPYHDLFLRETGESFQKQIYIFKRDTIFYLRSQGEHNAISNHLANFILRKKNYAKVNTWVESGLRLNSQADAEIEHYKKISEKELGNPNRYRIFLNFFYELVFYSTVVPYFVLHAAELILKTSKDLTDIRRAHELIKIFEPIRGDSRYPQVIEGVVRRYWVYISKIIIYPISAIQLLLPDEIEEVLQKKILIKNLKDARRRENCILGILPGRKLFFDFSQSDINKLLPVVNIRGTTITGTIAYRGCVKGIVKIVNTSSDMSKVNTGDVIVSINTNPSLMPALKKAAAIVTNDGGITCHAAIISRELKIPCIVGTKIATKVLHDGDLVEVDANKGIVNIIKRKSG